MPIPRLSSYQRAFPGHAVTRRGDSVVGSGGTYTSPTWALGPPDSRTGARALDPNVAMMFGIEMRNPWSNVPMNAGLSARQANARAQQQREAMQRLLEFDRQTQGQGLSDEQRRNLALSSVHTSAQGGNSTMPGVGINPHRVTADNPFFQMAYGGGSTGLGFGPSSVGGQILGGIFSSLGLGTLSFPSQAQREAEALIMSDWAHENARRAARGGKLKRFPLRELIAVRHQYQGTPGTPPGPGTGTGTGSTPEVQMMDPEFLATSNRQAAISSARSTLGGVADQFARSGLGLAGLSQFGQRQNQMTTDQILQGTERAYSGSIPANNQAILGQGQLQLGRQQLGANLLGQLIPLLGRGI